METPYNPGYRCPTCGAALVVVRKESRPLKNRYGRSRPALWGCPAGCVPAPGAIGWFDWAPEIQPEPAAVREEGQWRLTEPF